MNARSVLLSIFVVVIILVGILYLMNFSSDPQIIFKPQQSQLFTIGDTNNTPLNIVATTLPKFALSLVDQKFKNLWEAHAAERESFTESNVVSQRGSNVLPVKTQFDDTKKQMVLTPQTNNKLKPGLYTLNVKVKTATGKYTTITQDFTWGVLAINTNKGIYQTGEKVQIEMGVLDDFGDTKCITKGAIKFETAKVWLTITSPSGQTKEFSTDDGTIAGSRECGPKTVTNVPDFQAETDALEVGKYKIHMEAENVNGKRSIDDFFTVQKDPPAFDIERTSYPTRIYPKKDYPVTIRVKANQDYAGPVVDIVPTNFTIGEISDSGRTRDKKDFQTIQWQVDWKKGETYILSYTITFPPVSPDFYLVGPLTIGQFDEGREWQVASDSLFTLVQEVHNQNTAAITITATWTTTPGVGHLLVAICYRSTGSANGTGFLFPPAGGNTMDITTPSGTYTNAENNGSSTTNGSIFIQYKIAAAEPPTVVCSKTESNKESEPMGIQVLEFSGGSSSVTLDAAAGSHGNIDQAACTTSNTSSSVTPTNPNALIVTAYYATAANLTVTNHTNSFVDTDINGGSNGFANAATGGSFDSSYLELPAQAAKSDTRTLSGSGTACGNVTITFNTGNNFSEGSYRFFDNANSTTPGSFLAAVNTPVTLQKPRFRLRVLLRNDSTSGLTLPVNGGNFKLQYALLPSGGACSAQTFSDVTTSTPIAYADNGSAAAGDNISSTTDDPADGGYTTRLESYYDNPNTGGTPPNITNDQLTIAAAQAGLWDISLIDLTDELTPQTYCLRFIQGNGSVFGNYNNLYPQVTTVYNEVIIRGGATFNGNVEID